MSPLYRDGIILLINIVLAYVVYWDSRKKNIVHKNFWIVATVLFPPIVIIYSIFSLQASRKVVLSKKQKVEAAKRKQTEEKLREIAAEKKALMERCKQEELNNTLTVQEMEALKEKALAERKKQLQALEEERKYQQKHAARQLGIKTDAEEQHNK